MIINDKSLDWPAFPDGDRDGTMKPVLHVVDDERLVRETIVQLLKPLDCEVLAYSNVDEFLQTFRYDSPACLLVDIRMPGKSGLQLLKELREQGVDIPAIAMTGFADVPMAVEALTLGAVNFVEKPFKSQVLIDQVNACMVKARELWSAREKRQTFKRQLETLTDREREILDLMVTGASSKEIGRDLGISHRTVHVHRSRILGKFDVPSAFELALRLREIQEEPNKQHASENEA